MWSFSLFVVIVCFTLSLNDLSQRFFLLGFLKQVIWNDNGTKRSQNGSICSELPDKVLEVICSELSDKEVGCREELTLRTYAALL